MTTDRFTDDQWSALAGGPAAAAAAIIGSGHAGFFGTIKELKASIKAIKHEAPKDGAAKELVEQLMEYAKAHQDDSDSSDDSSGEPEVIRAQAMEQLTQAGAAANGLTAEELDGYVDWLLGIARKTAEAAPDKGEKQAVSAAETETLAEIERLLRQH